MRWEKIRLKSPKSKPPGDGPLHKTSPQRLAAQGPGRKWGHTCNAVQDGKLVYVFGGYGKDERQTNDIHAFDTVSQTWKKPAVKGSAPTPRDSHTCTTVGNKLFVFGGTDGNNPLRDLHVLDTVSNVWSKPRVKGDIPSPREGHSAALIGNRLFVFGGCGKASDDAEETYFNDLYILDTETMWWSKGNTTGTAPAARDSHTCSSWGNSLVVIGGEDSNNSYLSDVYILNAESLEWKQLETTGQKLSPRAGHAAVSIGKYIIIFGGFTDDRKLFNDLHILDIETGEWTKSNVEGARPSPRFSLAGDCVDDQKGLVFFIGGCNDNLEALDDIFFLETGLQGPLEKQPVKNVSMKKELKKRKREEAAKHSISAAAVTAASAAGKDSGGVKLQNQSQGNNEEGGETEAEVDGRAQTDGTMMDCSKHVAAIALGSCAMAAVDNPLSAQRSTVILALSHAQGTAGSATPTVAPGAGAALVAFSPPVPGSMYTERKPKHIEKIFEATVSDVFHFGYCISANIDGQPMKGMLFSYKPGFAQSVQALMFRKQLAAEAAKEKEKEDKKAERKAARAAKAARLAEAAAAEAAAARAALFATPTKVDFNHCPPVQMIEFLDGGVANYCGQIELQHQQDRMMLSEVGQQEGGGHEQASNQEQGGVQPQEGQEQQQVEQGSFEGGFREKHDDREQVQYCVEVDGDRCEDVDDTEEVDDGGEDEGEDAEEEMDEGEDGDEGDEDEEEHEDYEQQMHGVEHETGPYHEPGEDDEQQEYAIEMQQAQQQERQQDQQHYLRLQTPHLEHEYVSVAAQIDPSSGPCSDFPGEMHTRGHEMVQHFSLQQVDIHEQQQQQDQQDDEDAQHQRRVIADYPAELHGEGLQGDEEADGDYDSAMEHQVDEEEYVAQIQTGGDAGQGQQEEHYDEGGHISQGLGDVTVEDYRQHIEVDEGQEEYPASPEENEGDGQQQYDRETSQDENEGQNGSEMATACERQQYGHMQQHQQECESYASSGMQSPSKDNVQQRMSEQRHFAAAVDIRQQHGDQHQQQQQQHYLTSPSERSPKQYLQGDAGQHDQQQQQQQQQQHRQQQLQQHYSPAAVSQKQHHYSQEHFQGQPLQRSPQRFAHRQSQQQHRGAQSYPHPHAMSPQQFHHHHHQQQQQQQQQQMAHGHQGQPYHRTHQPPVSPQHHRRMQQTHQAQVQSSQAVLYGGPHHHPLGGHMMGTSSSMVVPSPHQQAAPYSDGGLVDQGMATIGLGHGGSGQISHQQGTTRMYMGPMSPMSPMSPTAQGGAASGGTTGNLLGTGLNIGMGQPMDAVQQVGAAPSSIPDHSHQYQMYGMGMGGMPMHYPHDPHHQTLRRE